jgi:hypothetical protein
MRRPSATISWILVSACFIPVFAYAAEGTDSTIEGLWFGRKVNGRGINGIIRTVLLIQEDRFIVLSPIAVSNSNLRCSPQAGLSEIDIDRFDGQQQRGVYCVVGSELQMTLAKPNLQRPTGDSVEKAGGVPHSYYVFQRVPTEEGLEVLRKQHHEIVDQLRSPQHSLEAQGPPGR